MRNVLIFISTLAVLTGSLYPVYSEPVSPLRAGKAEESVSENTEAEAEEDKIIETIELRTAADLEALEQNCHDDAWSADKEVLLMNDISLNESGFTSIPIFNGHFNGQGHRISGYSYGGDGYVTAFFRYLEADALVEDLTISAQILSTGSQQVTGGIVGMNGGTVKDCSFEGRIRGRSESGGIAGINLSGGCIFSCTNKGEINGYYYTGGIAGKNYGMIMGCTNVGSLNSSVEWVEEDDAMGGDILSGLTGGADVAETRIETGVDTGGIAGFSRGAIMRCTNEGTIGYEHTGYNMGGIAGRQSGTLTGCTNNGTVLGRKDVGGIVGQMEPYIEVMDREEISDEVDGLHDMVNELLDMMDTENEQVRADLEQLRSQADKTVDISDRMADQASSYTNSNIDVVNEGDKRLKYVLEQMPEVTESLSSASKSIQKTNEELHKVNDDADIESHMSDEDKKLAEQCSVSINKATVSLNEAQEARGDREPTLKEIEEEAGYMETISVSANMLASLYKQYGGEAGGAVNGDVDHALNALDDTVKAADAAQAALMSINEYLNAQQDLQLVKVDEEWNSNVDGITKQMDAMSGTLSALGEHSGEYSEAVNEQLRQINDQMNDIYEMARNEINELTNTESNSIYSDISDAELENISLGKVGSSSNYGVIRGDINIGGIAGAMSIDEEDPEENAAGSVNTNFGSRYTTQNVIQGCTNRGYITAKNDGAGGIVGFMRSGVVVKCYGYGFVESTEGNYVGGIAGQSLSILRDNAVLCSLSGGNYVGGIAGYGCTITGCYAMPMVQQCSGRCGAIAGSIKINQDTKEPELSELSENYYVSELLYGIDQISYASAASEISYQQLLETAGIPAEFRMLTVIFRVDDTYLGTKQVKYGDPISELVYPEIPKKEGYYGVWPQLKWDSVMGNLVISGEYVESLKLLQSSEEDDKSGRRLVLVDRDFDDMASLSVEEISDPPFNESGYESHQTYRMKIDAKDLSETEEITIRVYDPYEDDKTQLWLYQDGSWVEQAVEKRGSYLQLVVKGSSAIYTLALPKRIEVPEEYLIGGGAAAVILLILILVIHRIRRKKKIS